MAQPAPGWHVEDIKAALRKKRGPLVRLSRTWGFNRTAITRVLRHPTESMTVEKLIAQELGVPAHTLWPDRWTEAGDPLPRASIKRNDTTSDAIASSQKREAA